MSAAGSAVLPLTKPKRRAEGVIQRFLRCLLVVLVAGATRERGGAAASDGSEGAEPIEWRTHRGIRLRGERHDVESLRVRQRLNAPLHVPADRRGVAASASIGGEECVEREWLIHLQGPIDHDLRVLVAGALGVGEEALKYVPSNTLLVSSTCARIEGAKAWVPQILWAGHVLPHHKVSPDLHTLVLEDIPDPQRTRERRRLVLDSQEDAIDLAVELAPHAHQHTKNIAVRWAEWLGCEMAANRTQEGKPSKQWLRIASPRKLILRLHRQAASETLRFLVQQHETSWIEPRERFFLRNKWSQGIVQSGTAFRTPIFDRGLRGEGQIIGIADTGIDMNLCFFQDVDVPQARINNLVYTSHRKVISYRFKRLWGNSRDEEGHGSHTTGSLVGHAVTGTDQEYNGMAPNAKLVFDDIYADGDLSPPDDLEHDLFPEPYQHGARVRSESWGGDSMFYTTSAKEADSYSRTKRDFLVVWAAGNDGDLGMFTIGSPATAKNILCVGAQQSTRESMMLTETGSLFLTLSSTSVGVEDMETLAKWASFGPKGDISGTLVLGSPLDACGPITGNVQGKIVLVQRGTCLFTDKAQKLQRAGAAGMLCFDNTYAPTVLMGGDGAGVRIPCLSISRHDGEVLREMLRVAGDAVHVTSSFEGTDLWQQNLADFSGKGPTGDGRLMPDIVAPGADIWSARAGGTCGKPAPHARQGSVTSMGGTSMAAPVAAGGVALIRQYFEERWYPGGKKGEGSYHSASGALLRAMVMNGARRLTGSRDVSGDGGNRWVELDSRIPNNEQGYGAMNLEAVLYFDPQQGRSPTALFVRDDEGAFSTPCLGTGEATAFGFHVRSGKRFKVTIAWTDPPASLLADVVLVNDLDLTVLGPGNREWTGNNITSMVSASGSDTTMVRSRDRVNNKEQVEIVYPAAGEYTVIVRGHHVPESGGGKGQCYALVVTGDFDEVQDAEVACAESCAVHGSCVAGECVCNGLWTGVDCLRPIPVITSSTEVSATVFPDTWQYYAFDMGHEGKGGGNFQVQMLKTSVDGDPDLFIQKEKPPSLIDFAQDCECAEQGSPPCECREISCDSCDDVAPPARQLQSHGHVEGLFIIGVTGFCCDPVQYTLTVNLNIMGCDGTLNSGKTNDCDDTCGGSAVLDVCSVCDGDGTSCLGCDDIANSGKVLDRCNVCGGDDSSCVGCDGIIHSGVTLDVCGDCGGDGRKCLGCDGVPYSGKTEDVCGVCLGDGTSCLGCDGRPNSKLLFDACGVCDGDGSTCKGCDGVSGSGLKFDECGVCDGDNTECAGCDGVPNSDTVVDGCGLCVHVSQSNMTCIGCDGLLFGEKDDACGVCGGENDTCLVCEAGKPTVVDTCGVCNGDNSTCAWLESWPAEVRVVAAIQLSGISEQQLSIDTARSVLSSCLAEYLGCSQDKLRLGTIIERSSDARRRDFLLMESVNDRDVNSAAEAQRGAKRFVDALSSGEAGTRIGEELKVFTTETVKVSLAKPPIFEKRSFEAGQVYGDTVSAMDGGNIKPVAAVLLTVLVIAYVLLAIMLAWWAASVPLHARRPPSVVFTLWLLFGILGVHRFYTRTPKVGILYFFTLGVCGFGWLSDLYLQRKFLFGGTSKGSVSGVGGVNRLSKSKFVETWRRNRDQRRNRHQRLVDDVEGGGGGVSKGRVRGQRMGALSGGQFHRCDDDDDVIDVRDDMPEHEPETPTEAEAFDLNVRVTAPPVAYRGMSDIEDVARGLDHEGVTRGLDSRL